MKKYTIRKAEQIEVQAIYSDKTKAAVASGNDDMQVSDGYHSMDELYDHRITLFIAICRVLKSDLGSIYHNEIWRSKLHGDGTSFEGWFILGINKEAGKQITYHIPIALWDQTEYAETLDKAPEFDGHSSDTVLERIESL